MKRIILFLCVIVFSIFSNNNNSIAKEIGNNIKDNISNEIEEIKSDNNKTDISNEIEEIKPDNNKKIITSNSSSKDIFGDEQTFPFVAGLGKNAAH